MSQPSTRLSPQPVYGYNSGLPEPRRRYVPTRLTAKPIAAIALVAAVALLAFWAYTVYQKRETRNDIVTFVKNASDDLRASFKAHATAIDRNCAAVTPSTEAAPAAEAEARAAAAEARVKALRGMNTSSMRPLSDAADDYLVTVREILRRDADMARSDERLSSSLQAFAEHMQADRGMRTWPEEAVRLREAVVKDLRDHRIAVESYAALLEAFPASQVRVAAQIEPVLLIEEKTVTEARAQVLGAFAQAEKDITRLTQTRVLPHGRSRRAPTRRKGPKMKNEGKVAVVTGAGSGIGKATALAFLKDGWRVAFVGRRKDALEEAIKGAGSHRDRAIAVPADVGDAQAVQALFARVKEAFGRVDALFNNAGQNAPGVPFEDLPYDRWKAVVDTNLSGTFLCAQAAFRMMKEQDPARRPHHQQRLDLGAYAAPGFGAVHRVEARRQRPHAHDRARRPQIRYRVLPDRCRQRHDRSRRAHGERREAGRWRGQGGADDRSRRRGALGAAHGEPAARREHLPSHDHGDEDAVRRARLN